MNVDHDQAQWPFCQQTDAEIGDDDGMIYVNPLVSSRTRICSQRTLTLNIHNGKCHGYRCNDESDHKHRSDDESSMLQLPHLEHA